MPTAAAGHTPHWHRVGRMRSEEEIDRLEHRYVNVRLLGWLLIGLWQFFSLLSEFVPLDIESRAVRITGKILGLAGLLLVAWGFERLFVLKHPGSSLAQRLRG